MYKKLEDDLKITKYLYSLEKAVKTVSEEKILKLANKIEYTIKNGKRIVILGNGGSAANAIHISGDYTKTFACLGYKPRISTPTDNISFLTAASNDIDFTKAYSLYLESVLEQDTLVLFLSGSGNSMNLIQCFYDTKLTEKDFCESWSITAFSGGKLSKLVNESLYINISDMEIAEDIQIIIFHFIKQLLTKRMVKGSKTSEDLKYHKRTFLNQIS